MADASEAPNRSQMGAAASPNSGGMRERDLQTCDLRAVLAGFRSDLISLSGRRYMDNPDVGTMILHRLANVEGFTTSATSAMAPKDARKAYDKGLEDQKKNKPDDAQKEFQKAVEVYPKYASAWYELGRVYEGRDHISTRLATLTGKRWLRILTTSIPTSGSICWMEEKPSGRQWPIPPIKCCI